MRAILRMRNAWQAYEGPTWMVAIAIYGSWLALASGHRWLPALLTIPAAIYVTAWHSSLQHETMHAFRRIPTAMRKLIAVPPIGIWFPYEWYSAEHLRHHATPDLAGPLDPESFYHDPQTWGRLRPVVRALYAANQTLAGRLILGPALQIAGAYAREIQRLCDGDTSNAAIWARHLVYVAVVFWGLERLGVNPIAYVAFVAYPAVSLGLLRSFAEHRPAERLADRTRIVESGSPLSLLFLNNNLHAVHHAHPSLPWYELPQRYRNERGRGAVSGDTLRGYRSVAHSWLWRPIDSPVASPIR